MAYHYSKQIEAGGVEEEKKQLLGILKNFHLAKAAILTTSWTHSDQNELLYPVMVVSNDLEGINDTNLRKIIEFFKNGELNTTKEALSVMLEYSDAIARLHQ